MEMPRFSGLVVTVSYIAAAIGCLVGIITVIGGFSAFRVSFVFGLSAVSGGLYMILASLAGLGIVLCFLALVKAQIEMRNAVVSYLYAKQKALKAGSGG